MDYTLINNNGGKMSKLENDKKLVLKIEELLTNARKKVATQVNTTLLYTYMEIED